MHRNNHLVVALVYDGLCNFEFSCAAEVFGVARPGFGPDWYRFESVAAERGPLSDKFGFQLEPAAGLDRLADAGTIIVPGWRWADGGMAPVGDDLVRALRMAHARGARLLSMCAGSWVLAVAGLLDGLRATSHWMHADVFRQRYPQVLWDPGVLYVQEGRIITAAGSAASLDAGLHLVRTDFGTAIANELARWLVIQPHRDGSQAQLVERPVLPDRRDRISLAMQYMAHNLDHGFHLGQLAEFCAMSERTFLRKFKQKTGMTPVDWLSTARVEQARKLLEISDLPIEAVAAECGLGSATNLRHHFRRKLGINPTEYRKRFGAAAVAA